MYVMDMNDIRINLTDAANQLFRSMTGGESMGVEKPCGKPVKPQVKLVANGDQLGRMRWNPVAGLAVGDITLPTRRLGQIAEFPHNLAGGCILPNDRVDLKQSLGHKSTDAACQHREQLRRKAIQ